MDLLYENPELRVVCREMVVVAMSAIADVVQLEVLNHARSVRELLAHWWQPFAFIVKRYFKRK